jgi:hypothetical protein
MQTLKTILGYAWAALAIPLVLATFIGMNGWAKMLAGATGVTINPRFSGGEVAATIDHGTYQTKLHRPVFDGLISERQDGFVQLDWVPTEKDGRLPDLIEEAVDYDHDGKVDFTIRLDTRTDCATLDAVSDKVRGLGAVTLSTDSDQEKSAGRVYNLGSSRAARVQLTR